MKIWGRVFDNLLPVHVSHTSVECRSFSTHNLFINDVECDFINNMWYQHNTAPPHSKPVINKLIGQAAPIAWPSHSPEPSGF